MSVFNFNLNVILEEAFVSMSVQSLVVELFLIAQKFHSLKPGRGIYRDKYLFNIWCLLAEFKEGAPLAGTVMEGLSVHLSLSSICCFSSLLFLFSSLPFAHL